MMFWQRIRPTSEAQWVAQLEAGEPNEPTLRLADQLRKTPPVAPPLPTAFQKELRRRLINQHPAQRQPLPVVVRLAWVSLIAVSLVVGAVMIMRNPLRNLMPQAATPTLTATYAIETPTIQTPVTSDPAFVIYDRARLDWVANGKQFSGTGESWYTADGKYARYQLTSATGEIFMFYLDDGGNLLLPKEGAFNGSDQPITELYSEDNHGYSFLQLWSDPSSLLVSHPTMLRLVWPVLLFNVRAKQTTCHDAFCVLGVNSEWQCREHHCMLEWARTEGTRQIIQVGEEIVNGRRVGTFEFLNTIYGEGKGQLQLDLDSFAIIALEVYEQSAVHTRVQNFETKTLRRSEVPVDFFSTLPGKMTVQPRPTQPWDTTFHLGDVRAEMLDVIPAPGTISQPTTITLQLRYAISPSVENMEFSVDLLPLGVEEWLLPPSFHQTIQPAAYTDVVRLNIPVQPDTIRPGRWRLEVSAVDTTNQSSWTLPNIQGYIWCIACLTEEEQITVDRAFRTGSSDRILLNIAGRTMLPNITCIHTQLLADGEPVAWWPTDTCVIVRDRRWNFYVPLYKTGAPGKLTPGVTYSLRAWQRNAPEVEAVQEFADLADKIN